MKRLLTICFLIVALSLIAEDIGLFIKTQGAIFTEENSVRVLKKVGDPLENNTTLISGVDSYALLHYKYTDGSLRVFPNSMVNIVSVDDLNTKVTLTRGKVSNSLKEKITGSYAIETNSTVASVRGTEFEVELTTEGTDIKVDVGEVEVLNKISKQTQTLSANHRLLSTNGGKFVELTLDGDPVKSIEKSPDKKEIEKEPKVKDNSDVGGNKQINTPSPATPKPAPNIKAEVKKKTSTSEKADIQEPKQTQQPANNSFPVAVVLKVKGELTLIRNNKELACPVGTTLEDKDKIRTKENSLGLIKFVDNSSEIRLFSNSEVEINTEQENGSLDKNLRLEGGSLLSNVNKKIVGKYSVSTTSTIASVRGTEFLVELTADGVTKVTGFSGRVEVENRKTGETTLVTKGNTASSSEDGTLDRQKTESVNPEVEEEIDQVFENNIRIEFENEDGNTKTIILEY